MIQATKDYQNGKVVVNYQIDDEQPQVIEFNDESDLRILGECFKSLATGCPSITIR